MRRRYPLKNRKKWLSGPYAVWAAGFTVIPLLMIVWYAFTTEESVRNTSLHTEKRVVPFKGTGLWF